MHIICPSPPRPQSLHNLCSSFLLDIIAVPREIENNAYTKFGGRGGGGQIRCIMWRIGSFRAPPGLCIKTRLRVQPLIWNWFSFLMQWKLFSQERFCTWPHFKSEGFWISEVAYWVTINVAEWSLGKVKHHTVLVRGLPTNPVWGSP